jgi:hypothetical protein
LAQEYDEQALVACGLWTTKEGVRKPSAQFYGLGVVGKKKRLPADLLETGGYDDLEDDDFAWAWKDIQLSNVSNAFGSSEMEIL